MKPNIVIFNPDEMRWDTMSHMGNPAARTPFLDEFARQDGVSFSNAYCQNPVCVPSRCSFFTGLYPHVNGHRTMQHLLHEGDSTLLSELKNAGYYVWMNDRNDLLAGQVPGIMNQHADEVFYASLTQPAPGPEDPNVRGTRGDKNYYSHFTGKLKQDENGRNYTSDDATVDAAIERILHPREDKPLCMFLGLMFPHTPYGVEEPYFSAIDRSKLPRRAGIGTNKPKIEARLREYMGMEGYTEQDWDELRAVYLGMCSKVDDQFRRLCQALKDAGIYDNTAIFFFSDHGDYSGDYGIPEKCQNSFEDCLTRVPLLIKPPKGEGVDPGVTNSFAELVDFYATAMDYAGVKPDHDHFGKSLRPILENRQAAVRDMVFCEGGRMPYEYQCDEYHAAAGEGTIPTGSMYWPRQNAQLDDEAHAKGTMVRDRKYKYIHRTSGAHEFYDLTADPLEEHNVYGDARYESLILKYRCALLDWYQSTCDVVPRAYDSRMPPELMWERVRGRCQPEWAEEIRKMIYAGAGPAKINAQIQAFRKG